MKIVISLGGSVVSNNLTPEYFQKLVNVIGRLHDEGHELYITVGGGHRKKNYQCVVNGLDLGSDCADKIAIQITHLNANLLKMAIGERAYGFLPTSTAEVLSHSMKSKAAKKIFVCGGTEPGQSTDGVAAKIAKKIHADILIKASNVDGAYDSDPNLNPNAKKIEKISHEEFLEIINGLEQAPGTHKLFDKSGAELLAEDKIKMVLVNGSDPEEIMKAVFGGHRGTEIK